MDVVITVITCVCVSDARPFPEDFQNNPERVWLLRSESSEWALWLRWTCSSLVSQDTVETAWQGDNHWSKIRRRGLILIKSCVFMVEWHFIALPYLQVQHDSFTDPPQGEEPHVKVQTHLEMKAGQNLLVWHREQVRKALTNGYISRKKTYKQPTGCSRLIAG